MANNNCLEGVACPKCGQEDKFQISARVWAEVTDEGTEDQGGDYEWTEDSMCVCPECGYSGSLRLFSAGAEIKPHPLDGSGKSETITIDKVDIGLLRFQRDALLKEIDMRKPDELGEVLTGLVNLLDTMLDTAEGFVAFPLLAK